MNAVLTEWINYLNLCIFVEYMITLIYCPCKDETEARNIASALLEKKLIACANLFSSASLYKWKDKKTETAETILLCKTTKAQAKKAVAAIKKLHSYECPAILVFPASANKEFEKWVKKSTK